MASSSCQFLEQLYFRACAIKCDQSAASQPSAKFECVSGCRLAQGRPLHSAVVAYRLFGIEDDVVHDTVLSEMELGVISSRMRSIANGIEQACGKECVQHCQSSSSTGGEKECLQWCRLGCEHFVRPLT